MCSIFSDEKLIKSLKDCLSYVAEALQAPVTVILWDGSKIPLGEVGKSDLTLTVAHKGVIASLLKHPNLETIMRHYACGNILIEGGEDLMDFIQTLRNSTKKKDLKKLDKFFIIKSI